MKADDDRPISMYDNLNVPTIVHTNMNVPKLKTTHIPAATTATAATAATSVNAANTTNTVVHSPYSDLTFTLNSNCNSNGNGNGNGIANSSIAHSNNNDHGNNSNVNTNNSNNNNISYRQQQQHQHQKRGLQQSPNEILYQVQPTSNSRYAGTTTPNTTTAANAIVRLNKSMPSNATTTTTAAAAAVLTTIPTTTPTTTPVTAAAAASVTFKASPAQQRPLSQHSQSEVYEASQSIAAVKAALNDAKSKFFGLNGYASRDDNDFNNDNDIQIKLMPIEVKPQPKYQNIPQNSAIFRNQNTIAPPMKQQIQQQQQHQPIDLNTITSINYNNGQRKSQSPNRKFNPITTTDIDAIVEMSPAPTPVPTAAMTMSCKGLPATSYKQIPLNDYDSSQPSQAVYMSTTVPQNIKASKLSGRHTPTRNSLRHSRMLVVSNKNYEELQQPNPMYFKYPKLARWLLTLEILIGILILFLAIWILVLAPNTAIKDNPYWSGFSLLFAGILGLVLVRCQRNKRHKVREKCFIFLRADSYVLSLLAVLLTFAALLCASIHFAQLNANDTRCAAKNMFVEHSACVCTFNAVDAIDEVPMNTNTTHNRNDDSDVNNQYSVSVKHSYKVEYSDLSCQELNCEWNYILLLSIIFNTLGFCIAIFYIILLACYRQNTKQFYTSVNTSTF